MAQCEADYGVACYTAGQVRHAYGVDQLNGHGLTGRGQTIVLVDSYGSPTDPERPAGVRSGQRPRPLPRRST